MLGVNLFGFSYRHACYKETKTRGISNNLFCPALTALFAQNVQIGNPKDIRQIGIR
jgi:hypothetical protein